MTLDPFNCPKCGAHDYGLYAAGMLPCPHCLMAENAALRAEVDLQRSELNMAFDQRDNAWKDLSDLRAEVERLTKEKCRHGWRGSVPEEGARIVTPCPTCGGQLFVGSGGHLTCASVPSDHGMGCPQPGVERAINALRQRAEAAESALSDLRAKGNEDTARLDALEREVAELLKAAESALPYVAWMEKRNDLQDAIDAARKPHEAPWDREEPHT